jgi:hypothetical protein
MALVSKQHILAWPALASFGSAFSISKGSSAAVLNISFLSFLSAGAALSSALSFSTGSSRSTFY